MTTRAENAASPEALAGDSTKQRKRAIAVACAVLFLLSVGVRLLVWFNTAGEINKPLSVSTGSYVHDAHILLRGDVKTFLGGPNPPVDANILAHPPGYALLMTAVFAVHDSMNSLRVVQVILSSAVPVLMLLIAAQFLSWRAALLAGVLGALSPQLAYNSLLLLPDNLAVLPILLALWFLLRGGPSGNWTGLIVSGALLGVSVWFRANVLLLPVFVAAAAGLTLLPPGRRWRSAVIVVAALLVIAPITIRNYVVFGQFIPVSIGKGLNLAEGIGDYDHEAKFGMPHSDTEMMALEAKWHNRPEYANSFFVPDGIERDRDLTARSFAIMRANPGWFSTVLLRRGAMMLRMERVPAMDQRALSAGREPAPLRIAGDTLSLFQRPFITALFLPLSLAGFIILWRRREQRAFALPLAAGVIYFLVVHSWLHTEYRYVQLIPTIELILATTTVMSIVDRLGRRRINLAKN